jgi:hypothetical protein
VGGGRGAVLNMVGVGQGADTKKGAEVAPRPAENCAQS